MDDYLSDSVKKKIANKIGYEIAKQAIYRIVGDKIVSELLYNLLIRPMEEDFIQAWEKLNLTSVIDRENLDEIINEINYHIDYRLEEIFKYDGYIDMQNKTAHININVLMGYLSHLDDQIRAYYTLFYIFIYYIRYKISTLYNESYSKDSINDFKKEIITEALTWVFLSEVFGKDSINTIIKKDMLSTWGEKISMYLYNNRIFYNYRGNENWLSIDLGRMLSHLLLNIGEDELTKYLIMLLETHTNDDLEKLLDELEKHLPDNDEIYTYYYLFYNIVSGNAGVLLEK